MGWTLKPQALSPLSPRVEDIMRARLRSDFTSDQLALPFIPSGLRRIDPARNMRRFWSADVERDLFGKVVLVRRWGRIGTAGKVRVDEYPDEARALGSMEALRARKMRREYRY
jgi:predicted DNA-binding WGR domain protein